MTETVRKNNAQIAVMDGFREELKKRMEETEVTCYYIAKQLGVMHATIMYFVSGKREITPSIAVAISELLDMDTTTLIKNLLIARFNDCTIFLDTKRKDEILIELNNTK